MVLHRYGYFRRQRQCRRRLQRDFWKLRFDGFAHHGQYDHFGAARDGGCERLLLAYAVVVGILWGLLKQYLRLRERLYLQATSNAHRSMR